jgi:hypothetical protein
MLPNNEYLDSSVKKKVTSAHRAFRSALRRSRHRREGGHGTAGSAELQTYLRPRQVG